MDLNLDLPDLILLYNPGSFFDPWGMNVEASCWMTVEEFIHGTKEPLFGMHLI